MILHGIAASEAIDRSGEKILLSGIDISDFEAGIGFVNWEHKTGKDSIPQDIVGRILFSKKIYTEEDCEDEHQSGFWEKVKLPFLYIKIRLFDESGHQGAKDIAAMINDAVANKDKIMVGFSIQGNTLVQKDGLLAVTLAKGVAITVRPCNESSVLEVFPDVEKSMVCETMFSGDELSKAITADSMSGAAAGTQVGTGSLQRESLKDRIISVIGKWNKKKNLKKFLSEELPDAPEAYIDAIFKSSAELSKIQKASEVEEISETLKSMTEELGKIIKAERSFVLSKSDGTVFVVSDDGESLKIDGQRNPPLAKTLFDMLQSGELSIIDG